MGASIQVLRTPPRVNVRRGQPRHPALLHEVCPTPICIPRLGTDGNAYSGRQAEAHQIPRAVSTRSLTGSLHGSLLRTLSGLFALPRPSSYNQREGLQDHGVVLLIPV